ncbi:acyl-CoA N-acyltransferase [Penicillium malachiteum]|uniref:acyl-CoA N-acyltransferase n=1 Tax=Penicillium malachiteum TaxID=1324776 RepID=UPI0025483988|nr:acyl-CoA N-acyltransferase [Penicillium malachiteum]KAJ5726539.1 acyl-CoA N-acyltransferase [Penicillium malachiteum]
MLVLLGLDWEYEVITSTVADEYLIRRIQPSDIPIIAQIAATEYFDSELNSYLCPHRHEYPDHVTRRFIQMIHGRYLNPRSIGFVAIANPGSGSDQTPMGYAQFIRLGEDASARELISSQSSLFRTLETWWFKSYTMVLRIISPDRSLDHKALSTFLASCKKDEEIYWENPDMKIKYGNRWHAQSVVVSSKYQRKGIGRRLMHEALSRARSEGVPVGLEASIDGEQLYRSLGFVLRGSFSMTLGLSGGGIMMWVPE